jgi:hypothetical protein
MWPKEHLWNLCALRRGHLSIVVCSAHEGEEKYNILFRTHQGERPLGTPGSVKEYSIKIYCREVGGMD